MLIPLAVSAQDAIVVQSTTSTANSGLYDALLPKFTQDTGVEVHVVAVGTGQALRNARNCDGDVLVVHARKDEEHFVAEGFGTARADLMYNDFVIVGPRADPAGISGLETAQAALARLAEVKTVFVSRGDASGTHKKERALWAETGQSPWEQSGTWYRETGAGMGATLNIGIGMGAYVLVDRASWVSFGNKGKHAIMVQGDPALFNQYGVIPVSPFACPNVQAEGAQKFVDWLLSPHGQGLIGEFVVNDQQLFVPNASK